MKLGNRSSFVLPCLICGVDSGPVKWFLALFIGSLVLASVAFIFWMIGTKRARLQDSNGALPLEAEARLED